MTNTAGWVDIRVRFAILERVAGEDGGRGTPAGGDCGSVSRACWRWEIES